MLPFHIYTVTDGYFSDCLYIITLTYVKHEDICSVYAYNNYLL